MNIITIINKSWENIPPMWPLDNFVNVNPLKGLEHLPFEKALAYGELLFQQREFPELVTDINCETIRWCQLFFDKDQAVISIPNKQYGLYVTFRKAIKYNSKIRKQNTIDFISSLSPSHNKAIIQCLKYLDISPIDQNIFITLLLSTLSGWASYVKYLYEYNNLIDKPSNFTSIREEYLLIRLIIMITLNKKGEDLLSWHNNLSKKIPKTDTLVKKTEQLEIQHIISLIKKFNFKKNISTKKAQMIFCLDARSEPMRRAIEQIGSYETFGYAGFFGIPLMIKDFFTKELYRSCPPFVKPKHLILDIPFKLKYILKNKKHNISLADALIFFFKLLKSSFFSTFEMINERGIFSGFWILCHNLIPNLVHSTKTSIVYLEEMFKKPKQEKKIPLEDKLLYASNMLKTIGLIQNFSKFVILFGHGDILQNTSSRGTLGCSACSGRNSRNNALIMCEILNDSSVRIKLRDEKIYIPNDTIFLAGEHITITQELKIYEKNKKCCNSKEFKDIENDIYHACQEIKKQSKNILNINKSCAELHQEWGLVGSKIFIIAPRYLTYNINLKGKAFLNSYSCEEDKNGFYISNLLIGSTVLVQWINTQYMFSSLDNTAYGSGSRITHNITGKIGIMQGNSSDLMSGLPLQLISDNDIIQNNHPKKLNLIVFASRSMILNIIQKHTILQKLFSNGWIILICIDSTDNKYHVLQRNLTWKVY